MKQTLTPTIDDLKLECVLVQAWKKVSKYIRLHSWYADTLAVDYQSLRLPDFIKEIQNKLQYAPVWHPSLLRVVPAPKSQKWKIGPNNNWVPAEKINNKLRPLAHVSLEDQVLATAIMLCLADHCETLQGNTTLSVKKSENRKGVVSYGNRLFCDSSDNVLQHRWGSAKLYRQYFTDYQTFLGRPGIVVDELKREIDQNEYEIAVVHTDMSKFYDRVRPGLLIEKIKKHKPEGTDQLFLDLTESLFNWSWADKTWAAKYAGLNKIDGFKQVALPQGLVAAGFFANIVLLDFDQSLRNSLDHTIDRNKPIVLRDTCRYVDDLRLVFTIPKGTSECEVGSEVSAWLNTLIDETANGLFIEREKTTVTIEGREQRFLVPQSKAAARIQHEVSGTFDMLHGTELIGVIEGFFHTQQRYSQENNKNKQHAGFLIGLSDLRDDTATRFAAGKFRRTFRSLRPMLNDEDFPDENDDGDEEDTASALPSTIALSKKQLDERGRLFAAMLIEEWVTNPSNVRLLRIAFDLYPDHEFLNDVLGLLKDGWQVGGRRGEQREVMLYCLAELFRAGATETGIVMDDDCLPKGIEPANYHDRLLREAKEILNSYSTKTSARQRFPWYLLQQVFLYLAARNDLTELSLLSRRSNKMLSLYQDFCGFLKGEPEQQLQRRCIFTALAVSAFGHEHVLPTLTLSKKFIEQLTRTAPAVALSLWRMRDISEHSEPGLYKAAMQAGLIIKPTEQITGSLPEIASRPWNPFWGEENLLELAFELISRRSSIADKIITPWQIKCSVEPESANKYTIPKISGVEIGKYSPRGSEIFMVPDWCDDEDSRRRFELGQILRFALRGSIDFHRSKQQKRTDRIIRYRPPVTHWEQLRYAGFHGRSAFESDWIPISSWTEDLLLELLRWPGCARNSEEWSFRKVRDEIINRRCHLEEIRGKASNLIFLEQKAPFPNKKHFAKWPRPLRIGVVQTITPSLEDFKNHPSDPELISDPTFRRKQRQHLASVVEGIAQMLRIRETHMPQNREDKRLLDWLVFPELSVHPNDVNSIIIPFVREHRCMVLAGLVYHTEYSLPGAPLINSALWLIPEWTHSTGLQIRRIEQGKFNLAEQEKMLNPKPLPFRPAQWIVQYEWNSDQCRPLNLTASICYDSTDLALASDLKFRSDIYAVCALNKDVGTFDRMAESLHYHLYQRVLIVNNGQFGGSNFYAPFNGHYHRQVLHLHGQPQTQIAFIEVDPEKFICRPYNYDNDLLPQGKWKSPPAGWEMTCLKR